MQKVLIANRGEIAVRIIRACHDLGLQTVAVYSQVDHEALHVLHADEAICIGKAPASESYLKAANLISACEITGADAVHPGYGFLSEDASFASICESCDLNFIGPSSDTISQLGDKAQAKQIAKKAKVPTIPGSEGVVKSIEEAIEIGKEFSYPLFIKAVSGGGGRGIRIAYNEEELIRYFPQASQEAEKAFSNPDLYIEKMIETPRHVEVQVVADRHGNYVHLGERDCTMQRRRQKLVEEAPSPMVSESLRKKLGEAAVKLLKTAGYESLATVEFLLDKDLNFYFMEVNTRVQVEHTVTEELTGIDLVREQLNIAMGHPLSFTQEEVVFKGHVIQLRINAEDADNNFMPCPGRIEYYLPPGGPHVRVDSACYSGYTVPPYYDAMIAKLIVKGDDRTQAIARAKRALREFHIGGIKTIIDFQSQMMENPDFLTHNYDLNYVDQMIASQAQG